MWGIARLYTNEALDAFAGRGAFFSVERNLAFDAMEMRVFANTKEDLLYVITFIEEELRLMRKDILAGDTNI